MKKLLFLACTLVSVSSFAAWETITGNGVVKTETRQAAGYTGISLQGSMNVQLTYGSSNTITVEADENLLPYIETFVENGNLVIRAKNKVNLKSKINLMIHASLKKLTAVVLSGSGNIGGDGAFANSGKTEVKVSGSGNIRLAVDALNEVAVAISGSGNVILKGSSSNNIDATISGSGNIDCSNLNTNDVFAKVSGSGDIRVYANKSIDAKVSGSGNIYYKGAATNLSMKSSGSGKIIKA